MSTIADEHDNKKKKKKLLRLKTFGSRKNLTGGKSPDSKFRSKRLSRGSSPPAAEGGTLDRPAVPGQLQGATHRVLPAQQQLLRESVGAWGYHGRQQQPHHHHHHHQQRNHRSSIGGDEQIEWDFMFVYPVDSSPLNAERKSVVAKLRAVGLQVQLKHTKSNHYILVGIEESFVREHAEVMRLPVLCKDEHGAVEVPYRRADEDLYQPRELVVLAGEEHKLFSSLERQRVLMRLMTGNFDNCAGLNLADLLQRQIFRAITPLHDDEEKEVLKKMWIQRKVTKRQPLDLCQQYFGSKITFFFAFSSHYNNWLAVAAVGGLLAWLWTVYFDTNPRTSESNALYGGFILIWGVLYILYWRRRSNFLRFRWGLMRDDMELPEDDTRAAFQGTLRVGFYYGDAWINRGQKMSPYASRTSLRRKLLISYCIMICLSALVISIAIAALVAQVQLVEMLTEPYGQVAGSILLASVLGIADMIYRRVARILTDFENHRRETDYEHHLIMKQMILFFVNNFAAFYFIAFLKREHCVDSCAEELSTTILSVFVSKSIGRNIISLARPLMSYLVASGKEMKGEYSQSQLTFKEKMKAMKDLPSWHQEANMKTFPEIFLLYFDSVAQFGFLTLFGLSFTLGPVLALLTNALLLRNQAFSLLEGYRRPMLKRQVLGPQTWVSVLMIITAVSVVTNCALIMFTFNHIGDSFCVNVLGIARHHRLMLVLFGEHLIFLVIFLIYKYIPEMPGAIKKVQAEHHYQYAVSMAGKKKERNNV